MPEPVLVAIATALAGKAATSLYDLVKDKLSRSHQGTEELAAATATPTDPQVIDALARRLEHAEASDPQFRAALRAQWASYAEGSVHNEVRGNVTGKLLQARDIHGNINL